MLKPQAYPVTAQLTHTLHARQTERCILRYFFSGGKVEKKRDNRGELLLALAATSVNLLKSVFFEEVGGRVNFRWKRHLLQTLTVSD